MTQWKILIPAKVAQNGSFDTSNLLTIEQFNSFKNSDLKDIKKEIKDLKDRPTTSVDTSDLVSSELFNDYKSSNEQNITSLKEKVQVLENKEISNTSDFLRNSTFSDYKEWVN